MGMARQIRIEYPGAFYHVFSRRNNKQLTFLTDEDRYYFLNCLRMTHDKLGLVTHAYCLMPNHYHLLLETPSAGLSRALHVINTTYTVHFNRQHGKCGHLFQGRFRAILVQADVYAREVSRYIHLNPVRNQIVAKPDGYAWSSYNEYMGIRKVPPWMNIRFALSLLGKPPQDIEEYARFVTEGISLGEAAWARESVRTGILGEAGFIERIKIEYLNGQFSSSDREKPQLRQLTRQPDPSNIMALAERFLGTHNKKARSLAIFISHAQTEMTLKQISDFFGMSVSGVSNACRRIKLEARGNETLAWAIREIRQQLYEVR
jgi:REP element-mobilizing transposase RayT